MLLYIKRLLIRYIFPEIWLQAERNKLVKMKDEEKERALLTLSSEPLYSYLIALLDDHIRNSIEYSEDKRKGVREMVHLITDELIKSKNLSQAKKKQE